MSNNSNQTSTKASSKMKAASTPVLIGTALVAFLSITSKSAMAVPWEGHLATLNDAKLACRDIDSGPCLPYMAQAVAIADTLYAQAAYDAKRDKIQIPGGDGSIWACDPSVLNKLNGENLLHSALATESVNESKAFYWDDALFMAALHICRAP
jgi:hypothetical protein